MFMGRRPGLSSMFLFPMSLLKSTPSNRFTLFFFMVFGYFHDLMLVSL